MTDTSAARRIRVAGQVQGVGFRPYIYRLARQHNLAGSVCNQMGQVEITVQGSSAAIEAFTHDLIAKSPEIADPHIIVNLAIAPTERKAFKILPSEIAGKPSIHVPVDLFACADCLDEFNDAHNRRFAYPFINCTQCGPRYTLIESLPYDRLNTSMASFNLCQACEQEYTDPLDRRFHAEPIACAKCGPGLSYEPATTALAQEHSALELAIKALQGGLTIAVKGIGGYHLMCDAQNELAVRHLRSSKNRPHKPLAVMFSAAASREGSDINNALEISHTQWASLTQAARPIVLLTKRIDCMLAKSIAPGLNEIGAMLAYSPLHDSLLREFGGPVIATSGNLSGEPVITSNSMATTRLRGMADGFLHHNRPIVRPADDSVLKHIAGRPRNLRLGRGLAPLELSLPLALPEPVLALGGHMKTTIALAWDQRMVVSPHIGEMESPRSLEVFERVLNDFQQLYGVQAKHLVCDAHPAYTSHRWALKQDLPVSTVWHHHAHASALTAESFPAKDHWDSPMLVFTWDGVGWGPDHTLWGGETLLGSPGKWQRFARWRSFNIPGGDRAGREPWRSAAALCWALDIELPKTETVNIEMLEIAQAAWRKKINAPLNSSVGRLFDAASAILGLTERASFEGQGPMHLEALAEGRTGSTVPLPIADSLSQACLQIDWEPLIKHMLNSQVSAKQRAADWHESLATAISEIAKQARDRHAIEHVGLSGGVFQNRLLAERALTLLEKQGFICHFPEKVPINDGGLCVGQVIEYLFQLKP